MKTLGETIKEARQKKGLSVTALAWHLSNASQEAIDPNYISRLEHDQIKRPDKTRLKNLATILDLDAADILRLADYSSEVEELGELVRVPLGDISAGPGVWTETFYYEPALLPSRRIIALRVRGTSMEPEIAEGDIIYVDQDAHHSPGDIVIAWMEHGGIVKRLVKEGEKLYLKGNSSPLIPVTDDVHIAGVVFSVVKRLGRK